MDELQTETPASETPASDPGYESPGIGDMIGNSLTPETEAPSIPEITPEPEASAPETPAPVVPTPTTPAPATPPPPVAIQPTITPEIQALIDAGIAQRTKGLIGAIQGERQRRQELEQQLGGAIPADQADSQVTNLKNQMLAMSENAAKRFHKDYDQVSALFYAEAASNESLRDTVLSSPDPGEAAYQAGLQVKLMKELGPEVISNPYSLLEKGEQRGYDKARAELQKEFDAKLSALSGEKQKTPTDISQARSAGGVSVPYQSPSLTQMLRTATKRG